MSRSARSSAVVIGVLALTAVTVACNSNDTTTTGTMGTSVTSAAASSGTVLPGTREAASANVLSAVQAFLGMLSADQRASVIAERTTANLAQWSNLPDGLFQRSGLRMDELNADQKSAVLAILGAGLSREGYTQVNQITAADGVLASQGGPSLDLGADHYWIRFVGTPSATDPWTVQYGGHHLAVNLTLVGSKMTMAPTFWGAQPAIYERNGTPVEPLAGERTKAFDVMDALDASQRQQAILPSPVREIVLGAGQDGRTLAPEGLKAADLTAAQKDKLLTLVQEWLRPLNEENAAPKLATAQAEIDDTYFAWSGATARGQPIYYRVQSPTFHIEFAHQDGQGADAAAVSHIHSIYREPGNDYGARLG